MILSKKNQNVTEKNVKLKGINKVKEYIVVWYNDIFIVLWTD